MKSLGRVKASYIYTHIKASIDYRSKLNEHNLFSLGNGRDAGGILACQNRIDIAKAGVLCAG